MASAVRGATGRGSSAPRAAGGALAAGPRGGGPELIGSTPPSFPLGEVISAAISQELGAQSGEMCAGC